MDTTDRSDSKLPAPFPLTSSPSLLPRPAYNGDLAVAPAPRMDSRIFVRGLTRYWGRILLLWLLGSAAAAYLIYATVGPMYEAISRIRIEPAQPNLYDGAHQISGGDLRDSETYLQTQITVIKSDRVLGRAVASQSVDALPMIKNWEDPIMNLREKIVVEIEPGTYFIKVALQSNERSEPATIVNAVVDSYVDENLRFTQGRDANQKRSLTEELANLKEQIESKKAELVELHQKGTVQIHKPSLNLSTSKNEDEGDQPTVTTVDEQQVKTMIAAMVQNDLDLLTAKADLKTRLEIQKGQQEGALQAQQQGENDLEDRVKEAFLRDPEVIALNSQIKEVEDQRERHKSVIRKKSDAAVIAAQKELKRLNNDYDKLWEIKYGELRKALSIATVGQPARETIAELQHRVRMLQEKKDGYVRMYDQQKVERKETNSDSFRFTYATQELTSLLHREDQVKRNLAQVEFQSRQENYRVALVDKAQVPKVASNNKRWRYMAAAPVGLLFMMLGLFLLLEIKAERVGDPDALQTRVRSEVYALPPLPKSQGLSRRTEPTFDAQIEQFIQRLDHLRFAVCGNSVQTGKGRCVLITSAIGNEGKTTLAAQLASRCGTAGMSTLLIDADFRRSKLCSILAVPPESLGLSDVLKGQAAIEDVVVPVQGGTFSLLCAGTPIREIGALLQDRQFGMFITQLRQLYDLIIIDSPPVLPVPDALILGRWTDGAVLAARYDISRFPQVERARHQLDSAGIAVLGTVINGLRHSDSYYGRYTYSRRRSPEADSASTI
jgi:polysaccharide biosynthesis transport protein